MNLEEEIQRIINSIDSSWNQLEIVRFVYIEIGKIIEKNTEFYFTQSNKLQKDALSENEMDKINNVTIEDLMRNKEWYRVICRSAAILLKAIYDKLGISSHLIKTTAYLPLTNTSEKKVYHWILSVDINNEHYALTLTGDLHNIKNGFATTSFATDVPYTDTLGNQKYQGENLHFTIISPEKLEIIDKKIGYINTFYGKKSNMKLNYTNYALDQIKNALNNNWYYKIIVYSMPIYNNMFTITDENGIKSNITALDNRTTFTEYANQLIENVCIEVEKNIKSRYGLPLPILKFKNYETWIKSICLFLQGSLIDTYAEQYRSLFEIDENFDFEDWRKKQKLVLKCPYKSYDDDLELLDQVNTYVKTIRQLNKIYKNGDLNGNRNKLIKNIRNLHIVICEHFMPDLTIFDKNIEIVNGMPYIKSNYINRKFKTMFPIIFDTDNGETFLSKLSYSEQIATINKILPNIFPEITSDNTSQVPNFSRKFNPTLIRIRPYCILNKITGEYEIIFHIPSFFEFEDEFYYQYDLKNNTFRQIDIIEDLYNKKQYEILSTTLKNKFKDKELNYDSKHFDIEDFEQFDSPQLH